MNEYRSNYRNHASIILMFECNDWKCWLCVSITIMSDICLYTHIYVVVPRGTVSL